MTVFMKEAAVAGKRMSSMHVVNGISKIDKLDPAYWKTMVNGEVVVLLLERFG